MNIQKNIVLAPYTSFKVGGVAKFFAEVTNKGELMECIDFAKKNSLKTFFLGNGSNVIVSDVGFSGLVIKLTNNSLSWTNSTCVAGAGITLFSLIMEAKKRELGSLEWAYGIPATLGGAAKNNAGAFGSSIADNIVSIEILDTKTGRFLKLKNSECDYSYRKSVFQRKPFWIIWQVELRWTNRDKEEINKNIQTFLEQRKEKQPLNKPSAGSFFRNPSLSNLEEKKKQNLLKSFIKKELSKISKKSNEDKLEKKLRDKINQSNSLPAAYFIESAGLKGKKIGGAQVSKKHANFIINTGNATTENIIMLASILKQKVRQKFGVQLHEEVEYIGF